MRRNSWHIKQDETSYTLARHWPPRFDVSAQAQFPALRKARLARQIRQDLWRQFQGLRGFSPVVQIDADECHLLVTAGGRIDGKIPSGLPHDIQTLLDSPAHRARWMNWARKAAS
ncbi:MAG: hypothetical protein N4A70_20045 [Pelagimonas sp.]|nr:hypothetical protein [Pelagimonas sp.]